MRYVLDGSPEPFGQLIPDGQEQNGDQGQTSYRVERIESSFSMLSSKAKMAYRVLQICMVLLPFLFAVIGITLCAWWFYHKVLEPPITVLMDATAHIQDRDLNFRINFDRQDELGRLCAAFEKMRQTLYENNRQMWSMLEERRALQASVAHDLRNPIAIMTGYVEYLQENSRGGTLTEEKLEKALSNLGITAERMGRYTDTMRDLGAIEETEVHRREVELPDFLQHMADSLSMENNYCSFDELPLTLRVEDLMPILGIGRNIAYELVRSGKIKGIRIGKQIRIPKAEVQRFLSKESR